MLADRATIFVRAGSGGDGCVSMRREAHVPKGGPDGGDGGRGGDVVLVCDPSRRDLATYRRAAHFEADRGGHGEGFQRHGASAPALELAVPPGTAATAGEGETRWELVESGQRAVVVRGGSGGRGNKAFAGPTRQTPRLAERGLPGEQARIELALRLLADAGLVGLPNAGKSSLLARLTAARPKVAGYPFTTIDPVLGTVEVEERQLVLADIPGLIEGASEGSGLGHDFLAHVERCRLLVHVLDLAPLDGSDPLANHATVEAELAEHGAGLERLPRILCLSKADLVDEAAIEIACERWRERLGSAVEAVLATSAATGGGLGELRAAIARHVPVEPERGDAISAGAADAAYRTYRPGAGARIDVRRTASGAYRVDGERVEALIARHDLANDEALRYIEGRLRSMGVIRALRSAGFEPGDEVEIAGTVFELDPG